MAGQCGKERRSLRLAAVSACCKLGPAASI